MYGVARKVLPKAYFDFDIYFIFRNVDSSTLKAILQALALAKENELEFGKSAGANEKRELALALAKENELEFGKSARTEVSGADVKIELGNFSKAKVSEAQAGGTEKQETIFHAVVLDEDRDRKDRREKEAKSQFKTKNEKKKKKRPILKMNRKNKRK